MTNADARISRATRLIVGGALLSLPLVLGSVFGVGGQLGGALAAAEGAGKGGGQSQPQRGAGSQEGQGAQGQGQGMRDTRDVLAGPGDDSDRPDWAGGDKDANPHRGEGNPNPGVSKGDEYGDLWVYERDPLTGEVLTFDQEGGACDAGETCVVHVIICTDETCTTMDIYELVMGEEVPEGISPLEVDFGRLNIGRAPTTVVDHARDEALNKITADGAVLDLDPSGRITVDGVTIDSPLENLALYIGIMTGDAVVLNALQPLLAAEDIAAFDLAAVLLASAADKTGDIDIDTVWYLNTIYGFTDPGEYVDYSSVSYDRSFYDQDVSYFYMVGEEVESGTVNLEDYLNAINPISGDEEGITLFALAADDALEIIELTHTQIHEGELPGSL